MLQITERDVTDTLQFTSDLLDEIGPRLAGTPECVQAEERLHAEFCSACGSATIDPAAIRVILEIVAGFIFKKDSQRLREQE